MTQQFGYATGTINICRIVIPDSSHVNGSQQAVDGTVLPLGISMNAGRVNPDPNFSQSTVDQAALVGENIGILGAGEGGVDLLCAVTWNPGDLVMADANGKGIPCTAGNYYVGRAQGTGTVGALNPIDVMPGLMH